MHQRITEQFENGRDGKAAYWSGLEAGEAWECGERFDIDAAERAYWDGRATCLPGDKPEDNGKSWREGFYA